MTSILNGESFVCHKKTHLQCAGHMILRGERNHFVQLANRLGFAINLSGRALVFDTEADCVAHHGAEE